MDTKISLAYQPIFFTFKELIVTDTQLYNTPSSFIQVLNLHTLALFLDDIREEYGKPIHVNSAYRTKDVNVAVNGSSRSLHLQGRAADIRPCSDSVVSYEENLKNLYAVLDKKREFLSELILYPNFIHVAL